MTAEQRYDEWFEDVTYFAQRINKAMSSDEMACIVYRRVLGLPLDGSGDPKAPDDRWDEEGE